jgi:hypothetical protein
MLDGQDHAQIDSSGQSGPVARQKWMLTQDAFDKLLVALGGNRESGSEKYLEIRSNLTRFFEWRGCSFPEDHADETINRIAKKVAEGEQILNPSGYAMGVARLLLLESEKPTLVLSENARVARIQIGLEPEEPYKTFAVDLRTATGRQIWTRENLTVRTRRGAQAIALTLPATVLQPGQYELRLKGVAEGGGTEDVAFYYFNVTNR